MNLAMGWEIMEVGGCVSERYVTRFFQIEREREQRLYFQWIWTIFKMLIYLPFNKYICINYLIYWLFYFEYKIFLLEFLYILFDDKL